MLDIKQSATSDEITRATYKVLTNCNAHATNEIAVRTTKWKRSPQDNCSSRMDDDDGSWMAIKKALYNVINPELNAIAINRRPRKIWQTLP